MTGRQSAILSNLNFVLPTCWLCEWLKLANFTVPMPCHPRKGSQGRRSRNQQSCHTSNLIDEMLQFTERTPSNPTATTVRPTLGLLPLLALTISSRNLTGVVAHSKTPPVIVVYWESWFKTIWIETSYAFSEVGLACVSTNTDLWKNTCEASWCATSAVSPSVMNLDIVLDIEATTQACQGSRGILFRFYILYLRSICLGPQLQSLLTVARPGPTVQAAQQPNASLVCSFSWMPSWTSLYKSSCWMGPFLFTASALFSAPKQDPYYILIFSIHISSKPKLWTDQHHVAPLKR